MWLAGSPPQLLLTQGPDASVSGFFIIRLIKKSFKILLTLISIIKYNFD